MPKGNAVRATILAQQMERVEADSGVVPPSLDAVERCSHCARKIGSFVYGGSWKGIIRYPWLCSKCAAKWIALGGSVALRSVRETRRR